MKCIVINKLFSYNCNVILKFKLKEVIMVFCTNCGNKLEPNDKFCSNCGTPADSDSVNSENCTNLSSFNIAEIFTKIKNTLKDYLLNPVDKINSVSKNCEKGPIITLSILLSLIFGYLYYLNEKIIIKSSARMLKENLSFEDITSINNTLSISTGDLIFNGLLIALFSLLGIFAITFILSHFVLKKEQNKLELFSGIVLSMIPFIIFLFIGVILGLLNYTLTLICIIIGLILFITCLFNVIHKICDLGLNSSIYITSINILLFILLIKIFSKMIINSVFSNIFQDFISKLL